MRIETRSVSKGRNATPGLSFAYVSGCRCDALFTAIGPGEVLANLDIAKNS